jgi:hypothetical protein
LAAQAVEPGQGKGKGKGKGDSKPEDAQKNLMVSVQYSLVCFGLV